MEDDKASDRTSDPAEGLRRDSLPALRDEALATPRWVPVLGLVVLVATALVIGLRVALG